MGSRCHECAEVDGYCTCPHGPVALRREIKHLRHIVRVAGDFRDQIHPDVDWDRVPPWTMDVVKELDRLITDFDNNDT